MSIKGEPQEIKLTRADVVVVEPQVRPLDGFPRFARGVRRLVEIPYVKSDDVIHSFEEFGNSGHGRGMTGILRIAYEQLETRRRFQPSLTVTKLIVGAIIVRVVVAVLTKDPAFAMFLSGLLALFGCMHGSWLFKNRVLVRIYLRESKEISDSARKQITKLAAEHHYPKRLYADDIRMLRRLSKGDSRFSTIAKDIVDSVGA